MNDYELSPNGAPAGVFRIVIQLPSMVLSKTGNGYLVTLPGSGTSHRLTNCSDLWDVANNLSHYLHLTPALLEEIQSFRKKCAEMHWDDEAVASYYAGLAKASIAITREKTGLTHQAEECVS